MTKHQQTNSYFKPMVRIWKNMCNRMTANGLIPGGIAPSYYIEGLLWNVPNSQFGGSYQDTFLKCYAYIQAAERNKFVCANQNAWLLRKGEGTSWDPDQFATFFDALGTFWNDFS